MIYRILRNRKGLSLVVDDRLQVEQLLAKLREAVPLPVTLPPNLMASLCKQATAPPPSARCTVERVDYAGAEGGIMCRLALSEGVAFKVVVSITHLAFDRRLPIAREIAAYQKHRIKRLRRENSLVSHPKSS
jgi:hypothetical protein